MARLGVGLVGLGRWGAHVLRDLLALGAEVTVVSRGGRATGAAREQGAAGVVGSLSELPPTVRGLVVTTPTSSHAAVVESALETGLPLYVEKPLTGDPDAAARIAAAARTESS